MFLLNDSTHRMLMRFDPKIGHRYVPNLVARVPHETGGYLVRTNSSGFRSDLEFSEAAGDVPRILVFGDSFTAGEGCASQQRYPELLGQALGVQVYNYGMSGSAPDQHLLCYREFVQKVQADLIIWGIPLHNIERVKLTHRPSKDRVSGRPILVPKPYFTLEQGRLELHHVPVPKLRPEPLHTNSHQYTESVSWDPPFMERLLKSSLFEGLRDFAQHAVPGLKENIRALAYRISNTQLYDDYLDERSMGWTLLSALIRQFRADVQGIPILVVPLPTYHYYIDRLPPVYDNLYRSLEDPVGKLFVSTITNALHEGKTLEERKAMCFPTDTHYSPFGHQEIATLLAAEIQQKQLLPEHSISAARIVTRLNSERDAGKFVLGLSFGHGDAAAALVRDGKIIALAQESSFNCNVSQQKFPHLAVNYCLEEAQIGQNDLSAVIYGCELSSDLQQDGQMLFANSSRAVWLNRMSDWVLRELNVYPEIRKRLQYEGLLLESASVASQCASAFYSSPYSGAAVVNFGDELQLNSTTIAQGSENGLKLLKEYFAAHALQNFKSTMAKFITGQTTVSTTPLWRLALGGEPIFARDIFNSLLALKGDGSIELNSDYFFYDLDERTTALALDKLFGIERSKIENVDKLLADLAKSTQLVICTVIVQIAKYAREVSGLGNLCISGPLANDPDVRESLVEARIFDSIWFQPLTGNASAALGAALLASYEYYGANRDANQREQFSRSSGLFGPEYSAQEVDAFIDTFDYPSNKYCKEEQANRVAAMIAEGRVIGYFSGRLGVGAECVGDRLILSSLPNPNDPMDSILNSNLSESAMGPAVAIPRGTAFPRYIHAWRKVTLPLAPAGATVWARAIHEAVSPHIYDIIRRVESLTDCNVVATGTFGLSPGCTVCTPVDAYRIFMKSNMDALVLGEHVLLKEHQPPWPQEVKTPPNEQTRTIETVQEQLVSALTQVFSKKCMPAMLELRTVNAPDLSLTKPLVSKVPPELEQKRIGTKLLAKLLGRSYEVGPLQEHFQRILVEIIRLNRQFYKRR